MRNLSPFFKRFIYYSIAVVAFIPILTVPLSIDPFEEVGILGGTAFYIVSLSCFLGFFEGKPTTVQPCMRLLTHAALSYLFAWTWILLRSLALLPFGALLGITLGGYVFFYYVLGIVQLPINRFYRKKGYQPTFSLFYPLLGKKRRAKLLVGDWLKKSKEKFSFKVGNTTGEVVGDLMFVKDRQYGNLELSNRYFTITFQGDWNGEKFDAFLKKIWRYGFYAVGWRTETTEKDGTTTKVIAIPDKAKKHYFRGRKALEKFFKEKTPKAEIFLSSYEKFEKEVAKELTKFYRDEAFLTLNDDWNEDFVRMYTQDAIFRARDNSYYQYGVGVFWFCVQFPSNAPYEHLRKTAKDWTRKGYVVKDIQSMDKEYFKDQDDNVGKKDECNRPVPWYAQYNQIENSIYVLKVLHFNPNVNKAQIFAAFALSSYQNIFIDEYVLAQKKTQLDEEEKDFIRSRIAFSRQMTDTLLHSIPSRDEFNLLFAADSTYSMFDLTEAGLRWDENRKGWRIERKTSKIQRLFDTATGIDSFEGLTEQERRKKMKENKPPRTTAVDESTIIKTVKELRTLALDAGAITMEWGVA